MENKKTTHEKLAGALHKLSGDVDLSNDEVISVLWAMECEDSSVRTVVAVLHDTLEDNSAYLLASLAKAVQQWSDDNLI
jgi:hypothetical protein